MKDARKLIAACAIAATLLTLFAGCSNTPGAPPAPGTSGTSTEPAAPATDFPTHEITMIIPYTAGGGFDLQSRIIARYMPKYLPKEVTIIPVNVPGVANIAGSTQLYTSRPDGYTIGIVSMGDSTVMEFLNPDPVAYKTGDFQYIGCWAVDSRALAFNNDVKAANWDELVAESRAESIRIGTGGQGGAQHTDPLLVSMCSDVKFRFIHYEGNGQIVPAIGRGEVSGQMGSIATAVRQQEQDLGRAWCIFTEERDPQYPDVPTALELGMPRDQFDALVGNPFYGTARLMLAPPGTDPAALEILRRAFWDAMHDEGLKQEFETSQAQWQPMSGEDTQAMVENKLAVLETSGDLIATLQQASRG